MRNKIFKNKFYLIMLSGTIIMFGTEIISAFLQLPGEDGRLSWLIYDVALCLIGIVILERLAALSVSKPLNGSIFAICAIFFGVINQLLLSDGATMFGYSGNFLTSSIFFYLGSAVYFLSALVALIRTGTRTGWR
jgi:hypothetical protein